MNYSAPFKTIEELAPRYESFWADICGIESCTNDKDGVDRVGKYFIAWAREHGFSVKVHEEKLSGNAVAITMNEGAPLTPVCLSGHMDTVFPTGSFGYPSASLRHKSNGRLRRRGYDLARNCDS